MQQLRRTAMSVTRTLDDVASVGKKAAVGLAAIAAAATGVLQTTATFEKSMMRVKAVSQASVAEYKAMEKAALDMAKTTQYTAQQVAEGMGYMAMAGFKSNEIIGAMPTVLRLATAGMMDLATSADIVTNILTGYGLAVEDLGAATDVLVSAMTGANVDLEMLGESFKYVGPVAKGAGVSFEVTAAAIALLGNAGIQGSMAGTSLRQALSRLLNPTKAVQDRLRKLGVQTKTATGELLPFENIIAQLEKSGATAADMMEIFGDRAGPAMTALVSQGSNALMTFIDRLRESGGLAERIEKEQLNTLSGQWDILKSQIQGVAITLGQDLMPYARTLIYTGQQIVGLFDNLDASQRAQIMQWVALGGAILGIVSVLGVTAFAISAFIKGMVLFGSVVALLTSPMVIALTLIALAIAGLKAAWDNDWGSIRTKTEEIADAILEKWDALVKWWDESDFGKAIREAWDRIKAVWQSDELTLGQKVIETVSIVANTIADLVPCIRQIWDTWKDEDLSFGQKVLKTVTIVASSVAGLIESIMAWWTGAALNLVERGATLLGLNPDDLWIVQFLRDLNAIWEDSDLSFGQKIVETVKLLPGGTALVGFFQSIVDVWKRDDLTLPEKIVQTLKLTAEGIGSLIESIITLWINATVALTEKVVTLLGLSPEDNALLGFLKKLQAIWNDETLSFGAKIIESIELLPGGAALVSFFQGIVDVWKREDLSLPEKVLETVKLVASGVADLIESIVTWWINASVTLAEKVVTLLGLNPDENALVDFLRQLQTIWNDEELSFGQKIVKTVELLPGGKALTGFFSEIKSIWTDSSLTLPQKVVKTVSLTTTKIADLVESIMAWWTGATLRLVRRGAEILGLDPDSLWVVEFLEALNSIWADQELSFGPKIVETIALVPGGQSLIDFVNSIGDVWDDTDLTLGEKIVETIEISLEEAVIKISLATLAGVALWKIFPSIYASLSSAITAGAGALAAGGLVLGKIAVVGLILALAAGAIGWAFGDKEGRAAFIDAINESVQEMGVDEPISIPIALMGVVELTFDFGAEGIRNLREQVREYQEKLQEWQPGKTELGVGMPGIPEWAKSFIDMGLAISGLLSEGVLLGFDLIDLLIMAVDKAVVAAWHAFVEAGKKLGNALLDGIAPILDKFLPGFLTPGWVKERVAAEELGITDTERQMLAALAQLEAGVDGVEGMAAVVEVVFNRMETDAERYGGTVEEVIRKTSQFEPVMTGAFDDLLESGNIAADAIEAVDTALRRLAEGEGVTGGATYFANLDIVRQRNPQHWMLDPMRMVPTVTIGGHTFGVAGYQTGGYTGNHPTDEVVGVVHGQEIVIPAYAVRKGMTGILEFLGVPGFQSGRMVSVPGLGEAQSIVVSMQDMFKDLGKVIVTGLAKLFDIIAGAIEALAVALVGEEKVAEIKAFFAEMRAGLQDFIDGFSETEKLVDVIDDATEEVDGFARALEDVIATVEDTLKTWVRKVPILSDALAAYENAVKSQEDGGLGLGTAGGIAAAALAALSASSKELSNAIEAVSQGFAALIEPLNGLLRSLGPAGAGGLVGAGIGYGAAMLLGMTNPIIGVVAGGLMGLFGGVAQQQAEAAELQIEAANQLVQAARNMNTEARYGAIDDMRRAIGDTESTIRGLESSIAGVSALGAVGGAAAGYGAALLLGAGPLGLLFGALLGAVAGGTLASGAQQRNIEETMRQLDAQREVLDQLIEDFKGALGITVSDLVGSVRQAFSAETVQEFSEQLETSLMTHVRNALIAGFLESAAMRPLFEMLSNQIFEAVRDGVTSAGELDAIRDTISQISDHSEQFYSVLDELGLGMKDLNKSVDSVNSALRNVPSGFKIALRRFQVADPIPLAEGGIVTRPTFAMVGERGPEAVIPLGEAGKRIVVEVNVEGSIYADDFEDRVRRAVVKGARDAGLGRYGLAG
ncbi:phage tail tape measure protein, partial [Candidatus Darwinibacter acetoxidans]